MTGSLLSAKHSTEEGRRPSDFKLRHYPEMSVLDNLAVLANFDGEFSNRSDNYADKGAIKVSW